MARGADKPRLPALLPDLPAAGLHCVLLTLMTVMLASLTGRSDIEPLLRPLFFALLFSFFRTVGTHHPHIRGLPMRLVETGFLVLTLGSTASAVLPTLPGLGEDWIEQLQLFCDRGAVFLLGFVLLAYGLLLWIPQVLDQHRRLAVSYAHTQDELADSESARSRMEQRLVDADRLSMLGELAAGFAHDLRNPLTIVKGTAEALLRRPRSAAEIGEHATIIARNVERAERTIQSLLDLGRPRRAQRSTVGLEALFGDLFSLLQGEARRRRIECSALVGDLAVAGDRDLLLQILLNLLLNAVHATPDGGAILVRARTMGRTGKVAIAVEDRGPGLPAEIRQHLFTPFFTTRSGGTGLGLLSSRRLAKDMGGALGLYPRRRGGARAVLLLPSAAAAAAVATPVPEACGGRC